MFTRHTFWLKTSAVLQLLTAAVHSISFIAPMEPRNEQERQLHDLMNTHRLDGGLGFNPTMHDLVTSLSACMPVFYIFGALITLHLLRRNADLPILRGAVRISVLMFGAYFVITALLTFPPPIILTGLVFISLLAGWATLPKRTA